MADVLALRANGLLHPARAVAVTRMTIGRFIDFPGARAMYTSTV
ncbi:MAG: hypothetical protein WAK82_06610 [Streptosporangiaceae bacterium]